MIRVRPKTVIMRALLNSFVTALIMLLMVVCCSAQQEKIYIGIDGPSMKIDEELFVSNATLFHFQRADEAIEYSIDSGKWILYKKTFNISEEGPHSISYRMMSDEQAARESKLDVIVDSSKPLLNATLVYKS